jgi:hypothetical protein
MASNLFPIYSAYYQVLPIMIGSSNLLPSRINNGRSTPELISLLGTYPVDEDNIRGKQLSV